MPDKQATISNTDNAFCWYGMFHGIFIPDFLLEYEGISLHAKVCFALLCRLSGRGNAVAWPTQDHLAQKMGIAVRSVRNYISELEQDGFIRIEQLGLQRSNRYVTLRHPLIDRFMSEKPTLNHPDDNPIADISMTKTDISYDEHAAGPDRQNLAGQERQNSAGPIRQHSLDNTKPREGPSDRQQPVTDRDDGDEYNKKISKLFFGKLGKKLSSTELKKLQGLVDKHGGEEVLEAAYAFFRSPDTDSGVTGFSKNYGRYASPDEPREEKRTPIAPTTSPARPASSNAQEKEVVDLWLKLNGGVIATPPPFLGECLKHEYFQRKWRYIIWLASMLKRFDPEKNWMSLSWVCKRNKDDNEWGWEKLANGIFDESCIPEREAALMRETSGFEGKIYD